MVSVAFFPLNVSIVLRTASDAKVFTHVAEEYFEHVSRRQRAEFVLVFASSDVVVVVFLLLLLLLLL